MNVIYFFYFLLKSDYKQVKTSLNCLNSKYNRFHLFFDALFCSLKYGTSFDDYFSFRFYQKSREKRADFATTGYMYKFHKTLNHKQYKSLVDDKSQFRIHFSQFSGESEVFDSNQKDSLIDWLKTQKIEDFVVKDPLGTIGKSISFFSFNRLNNEILFKNSAITLIDLFHSFSKGGFLYVEPRIQQHSLIHALAPTALNTVRIITVLRKDGKVDIISAAFRISVNNETDNFSTGNLAASVDLNSGIVLTPGIQRMAACSAVYKEHPITGIAIEGFLIPHWNATIELVKKAAIVIPQVRTVGWDVAILEDKSIIIEGNPSWNKGAPQIPSDKGIKPLLDIYLGDYGV